MTQAVALTSPRGCESPRVEETDRGIVDRRGGLGGLRSVATRLAAAADLDHDRRAALPGPPRDAACRLPGGASAASTCELWNPSSATRSTTGRTNTGSGVDTGGTAGAETGCDPSSGSGRADEISASGENGAAAKRRRVTYGIGAEAARDAAARRMGRQALLEALATGSQDTVSVVPMEGQSVQLGVSGPSTCGDTFTVADAAQGPGVGLRDDALGQSLHPARPAAPVCDRPEEGILWAGTCADDIPGRDQYRDRQPPRSDSARRRLRGKQPPLALPAPRCEFDGRGGHSPTVARRCTSATPATQASGGRPPDRARHPSSELRKGA